VRTDYTEKAHFWQVRRAGPDLCYNGREFDQKMPVPLFAANWKMHKTHTEAAAFFDAFLTEPMPAGRDVVVAPSFPLLAAVAERLTGSGIAVAAQDLFHEDQGAFTGAVSPLQVRDAGATWVIVGHSERRQLFGETDQIINQKLQACARHDLTPIFCVGETQQQRADGVQEAVVLGQIQAAFTGLRPDFLRQLVVAYEPVWAIGTGVNATPEQAQEMHQLLRKNLPKGVRIVYGGSVKPENAVALLAQPDIDGFLVGGASLDPASFRTIVSLEK
jgi:triosephosphate isomerase